MVNRLWIEGKLGKNWETAKICPIFKAGNEEAAENYKGISLLNVGYKILTSIMADRLNNWLEENGKLGESQAGFRAKRSTRDHIFVLHSLINNKLKSRKGKLYAAFIDFKAAFDSVNRKLLIEKLINTGVNGRMLAMSRTIYRDTKNCVITSEGVSETFQTHRGVRQGCPLSPVLFNLFIEDLEEEWKKKNLGGTVIGKTKIFCLKFADDVVVVADDREGLKDMPQSLEKYTTKNQLEVNTTKTKIMIFRKGGKRKEEGRWTFKGNRIEIVNGYKYLGLWFTTKNSLREHIRMQTGKAQKQKDTPAGYVGQPIIFLWSGNMGLARMGGERTGTE